MMDEPCFDEVLSVEVDCDLKDMVVHRGADGVLVSFHSPLNDGSIHCSICEGGARVYLRER